MKPGGAVIASRSYTRGRFQCGVVTVCEILEHFRIKGTNKNGGWKRTERDRSEGFVDLQISSHLGIQSCYAYKAGHDVLLVLRTKLATMPNGLYAQSWPRRRYGSVHKAGHGVELVLRTRLATMLNSLCVQSWPRC